MNRNQKNTYLFIYDESKKFYRASQSPDGSWVITSSSQMYPILHNPKNLLESPVDFATNRRYFSMMRSINYPLEFTFDGAAILNSRYLKGKGPNEILFLAMFEFDDVDGIYKLSYNGRFDFQQKKRDEKLATFTIPVVDDSAWGILSQNEDVEYAIDCSENNPKVIKVLIDDFTLNNRYTYQTVQAPVLRSGAAGLFILPFVLVNQDGDSSGIVAKSQSMEPLLGTMLNNPALQTSFNNFIYSYYPVTGFNLKGTFSFTWSSDYPPSAVLYIFINTSAGQVFNIFKAGFGTGSPALVVGQTYVIPFDFTFNLAAGEKVFLLGELQDSPANHFQITPIVSNTFATVDTKAESTIVFGLRPLDLLRAIVKKATLERYSIDSNFFLDNNKTICVPGDSFRGVKDAKIYTSFRDFFETFSALFFMALRVVNGSLFMELADDIYGSQNTNLIDLGELMECETFPAVDFIPNQIQVGSPKQDYRHISGRLEFNGTNTFSLPFNNIKSTLSLVTKYRTDCYGMIFLILDYRGQSTKDNSGDKSVFVVDITDEQGSANQNVETFENINVVNAPLAPIIKFPLTGDIINFDKPLLKGVGIPGTNVNIYIETTLDGGTVVDSQGNWEYQITASLPSYDPGINDGVSVINATNTDLLGALDTIQLIVDTTTPADTGITYPRFGDALYNNLPLIKGVAPAGTNIDIFLDSVLLASVVTNNSCRWEYKVVTPLNNGSHTLDIGTLPVDFSVNSFVAFPLITYIGSELDGFPIVNNLPLIRGVAIPGTIVELWLNYVSYASLGSAIADSNGDWSFQVIPVSYPDPLSGLPVVLAPIRNGLSVVSTLLINNSVKIAVSGFKLNRPAYSSITGVPDNTVFNTRLSPMNMMLNHKSLLSSIMNMQRNDIISFQKPDKNPNLRTVLNGFVTYERANISPSSLGAPLMLMEYAKIKTVARKSMSKILYEFNSGGTVKGIFKGTTMYFLPIGNMSMKSIKDDVQDWQLLLSPRLSYNQLLNLYKNGLTINLMQNSIFHSDYNSLHMVSYDLPVNPKYNFKTIYDDWFTNRNDAWITNPQYIQKYQTTEIIRDQIITNGISSMTLKMYRCKDAALIDTLNYEPVSPAPIPVPEIVLEAEIDLSDYPEDQYFFVAYVSDEPVYISERIETRLKWKRTILIESTNSINMPGVFYSTGFKTIIRVEGLVKKLQPNITVNTAKEESGNAKTIYSLLAKKRMIRYGTAQGLPDYLAIKVAAGLINDGCIIEGVLYTLDNEENMNQSEDQDGVPMYYYNVNMLLQDNSKGKVFPGQPGANVEGVILVVDASAIGLPAHSLINITEG